MTWRERVNRGSFSKEDHDDAASWATCAVGEQHSKFPSVVEYSDPIPANWQWRIGGPTDDILLDLGCDLFAAVSSNDSAKAGQFLDQIEAYVRELASAA